MSARLRSQHFTFTRSGWLALSTALVVTSAWAISESTTNTLLGLGAGAGNPADAANTFIGSKAGMTSNGGGSNTLIGTSAGEGLVSGSHNTFVGVSAGLSNAASENTFVGRDAGRMNTSGIGNTFIGRSAGRNNAMAGRNTFTGFAAGLANTDGNFNTFYGADSGRSNTSGNSNTFVGRTAGFSNSTGENNTFTGDESGYSNTTGSFNAFHGTRAGVNNTGSFNTFSGFEAGRANSGDSNAIVGYRSGVNNEGLYNVFIGVGSGGSNTFGSFNSFLGDQAGVSNISGGQNTFVGRRAGISNTVEANNSALGFRADLAPGTTNATAIGFQSYAGQSNSVVLGGIPGVNDDHDGGPNIYVNVGIGTATPARQLDIGGVGDGQLNANTTALRITNAAVRPDVRSLIQLQNNGNVRIDFKNVNAATGWSFGTRGTGNNFAMTTTGSSTPVLDLSNTGTLTISGALVQNSNRNDKTGIAPVDTHALLGKVEKLPISRWFYRNDTAAPHVGPMAQDFHAAFGLGTDPTKIAPGDMAGIALAAIQAQQKAIEAQRIAIERLESRLASSEAEVATLRAELHGPFRTVSGVSPGPARRDAALLVSASRP